MANIALNKPSGGQLILSPEDGTSTETVTIPSVGVGKVLQVVDSGQYAHTFMSSSTSYVATGHKLSITPTSASSKIIIIMHTNWLNQGSELKWYLTRNGSNISVSGEYNIHGDYDGNGGYHAGAIMHTDSPNTTSSVEYEIYASCNGSAPNIYLYRTNSIVLMEVAN